MYAFVRKWPDRKWDTLDCVRIPFDLQSVCKKAKKTDLKRISASRR